MKKSIPGLFRENCIKQKTIKCRISGKKAKRKMQNEKKEFVVTLQGKYLREFAQKLVTGKYTIEMQSLNRYRVYCGPNNDYTLINRRSFVLLDKELYRIQSRENPLAAAIERALDTEQLIFTINKEFIDKMPVKLIARTLSQAKVKLTNVYTTGISYLLKIELVQSISERELNTNEQAIKSMFTNAGVYIAKKRDKQDNPETPALPAPETTADAVDTTAETIPTK